MENKMKCKLCERITDDPTREGWFCPKCGEDLLKQGTLEVEGVCKVLQEGDACDKCGIGIMVTVSHRRFIQRLPNNIQRLDQEHDILKCKSCGHLHAAISIQVPMGTLRVSYSHPHSKIGYSATESSQEGNQD
jgi:hypothetical protein